MVCKKIILLLSLWALMPVVQGEEGGVYTGTIRPYYESEKLLLELLDVKISGRRPACAKGAVVRLDERYPGQAQQNKFLLIMESWFAGRSLVLTGTASCTVYGEELISDVMPQ